MTSLDSWKISELAPSIEALQRGYVFGSQTEPYDRWEAAIALDPVSIKHITRYAHCGENAWIAENTKTGLCRVTFNSCKLRCCPVCCRIAARRVKERLSAALHERTLSKWRLITLTVPAVDQDLKTQLRSLIASFKALRKTPNWKKYVTGGYSVLEVTYNEKTDRWHPHLHVTAGGLFYPWKELRDDWKAVTGNATVTDIRPIKSTAAAVKYLTSYLGKLTGITRDCPIERLNEYYRATHGVRFLICFGKAPRPKKIDRTDNSADWRQLCPLWKYVIALRDGEIWALVLGHKLKRLPLGELEICDHHPPPDQP